MIDTYKVWLLLKRLSIHVHAELWVTAYLNRINTLQYHC